VSREGQDTIAGRRTDILQITPVGCQPPGAGVVMAVPPSTPSPGLPPPCSGTIHYWVDVATGWVLQAEGDDGRGGGSRWQTRRAQFDQAIDPAQFRFRPPPGSQQVDQLDD
jgi:hypothetical protein